MELIAQEADGRLVIRLLKYVNMGWKFCSNIWFDAEGLLAQTEKREMVIARFTGMASAML